MSTKLTPADETFQSLMHGGAVTGLCICAGPKVIRSRMPFSTHRIEGTARLVDEAFQHQAAKGRPIDRFWFGLGTFNLLAVSHEGMRIIILHVRDEETDFLAQIGHLFLKDYGKDFLELPEHKRLVTARILVTAPDSGDVVVPPLPANPATSRIPLSSRFKERQKSQHEKGPSGPKQPVIPKPIGRAIVETDSTNATSDSGVAPPVPGRPKIVPDDNAPDEEGAWPVFHERLLLIMERAVGAEKANAIIGQQIEEFAGDPQKAIPESWIKEFGESVVSKIPKRPSQDRARSELVAAFRELSL